MTGPLTVSLAAAVRLHEAAISLSGLALRPAVAFQVLALKRATAGHHADFLTQTRAIIVQHCDRDTSGNPIVAENGTSYKLSREAMAEAQALLNDLGDVLVTLPDVPRFVASDFPDTIILTADTLEKLTPCLTMAGSSDAP